MLAINKSTSKQQSKKRKQEETSHSINSDCLHQKNKNRKINENNHDDDDDTNGSVDEIFPTKTTKISNRYENYSYESSLFKFDPCLVLDILMPAENIKLTDDMVELVLKTYEETAMKQDDLPCAKSHGQLHLFGNTQKRRNRCRIFENSTCLEEFMCVHSEEFTKDYNLSTGDVFVTDGWLIYRCKQMKNSVRNVFSTIHGIMIGDNEHPKTIHWLGVHKDHFTIRRIDREITEIVREKTQEDFQEPVSKEEVKQELDKISRLEIGILLPKITDNSNSLIAEENSDIHLIDFEPPEEKLWQECEDHSYVEDFDLYSTKEDIFPLLTSTSSGVNEDLIRKVISDGMLF